MCSDFQEYFNDPFLKENKIFFRHYQNNIFNACKNKNSLVVLATGLGKTIIGILLITNALKKYPLGKILVLAPTRPLVSQHEASCQKFIKIDENKIITLTGRVPSEKRLLLFTKSQIIISTPQIIKNDVERGRYDLKEVSLIIFDEAHRTKKNYAYNFISNEYIHSCSDPTILGLTASPGKNYEHIQQICNNLYVEKIIFKHYNDKDVIDYIHEVDTYLERVELPIKILELSEVWNHLFHKYLKFFIKRELINPYKKYYSKLDFLRIAQDLTLSLKHENYGESIFLEEQYLEKLFFQSPKIIEIVKKNKVNIQSVFSYCSSCISMLHGKDLLETQDVSLFKSFLERIKYKAEQEILSAKRIINSKHYKLVSSAIENIKSSKLTHPKIDKLISIINEELEIYHNKKIIIFTQYREMAQFLKVKLNSEFNDQIVIEKFIGQATKIGDRGLPQYLQLEILKQFRGNKINVLIATSVAEEGLDIPNVDAIIFYEPVPSEIRLIQRRGRTGRSAPGRCYILVTKDTVDVPFHEVAMKKEQTMNSILINSEQLELTNSLTRKKIKFSSSDQRFSELELIKNFRKRKDKEKELLANRTIEEIISELDNFTNSNEYKKFKNHGMTFYSDIIKFDKIKLKNEVLKLKGKKNEQLKERKYYLNNKTKTLINIIKTYSEDGKLNLETFKDLAEDEDITDRKFYTHLNHACYLGYLKKEKNKEISFVKDYS